MKGLCGNYDENEVNDFQTPSGGALAATAKLFGDSCKLQPHCPLAQDIQVFFLIMYLNIVLILNLTIIIF